MGRQRLPLLRIEALQKPEQDLRRDLRVRCGHGFRRVVADPLLAAHEEHPDLGQKGHGHGIVARAARELAHLDSFRPDRLAEADA